MANKTYICYAKIAIRVEADDEHEASYNAGMEMDIGDIDWDVEELESNPLDVDTFDNQQSLVNVT